MGACTSLAGAARCGRCAHRVHCRQEHMMAVCIVEVDAGIAPTVQARRRIGTLLSTAAMRPSCHVQATWHPGRPLRRADGQHDAD